MTRRLQATAALLLLLATAACVLAPPAPASAQVLKLASLRMFRSDIVGPWVSYRVRTQSGRSPVREFRQRVAIVSTDRVEGAVGYWVELKTVDRAGTRIERGLFAPAPEGGDDGADPGPGAEVAAHPSEPLRLIRYQMLAPGGKLYEYPVSSAISTRAGGGVSTFELFEFDPTQKPVRRFLGPDTLRLGRRVVPSVLEWTSRTGADDWGTPDDSLTTFRLRLTQTFWRNAAVPITGFARSLFRVTTQKVPVAHAAVPVPPPPAPGDSLAAAAATQDSLVAFAPADTTMGTTSMQAGDGRVLSWTELVLEDLGADAVAEITQKAEPAPASDTGVPADMIR